MQNATFACSQKVNPDLNLYYYSFGNNSSLNLSRIQNAFVKIRMEQEFTGKILIFSRMLNMCDKDTQQLNLIPTYLTCYRFFGNQINDFGTLLFGNLEENICPISHDCFNIGDEVVQCNLCKKNYLKGYFDRYRKYILESNGKLKCPYCRTSENFGFYKLV